jgi:hypothetical protein
MHVVLDWPSCVPLLDAGQKTEISESHDIQNKAKQK